MAVHILNLIENTEGSEGLICAHGLSFYVRTGHHKLLCDLGPSEDTVTNALRLGVDLEAVDTVILSHGHYDHSGGIMPFAKINTAAPIYMQRMAVGDFYSDRGGEMRYIGIDKDIAGLPQTVFVDGDLRIDDELSLFVIGRREEEIPPENLRLKQKVGDGFIQDDFRHEQFLVINDGGKRILMSGCAHNGILNILREFDRKYGGCPDIAVSGFHLKKKEPFTDEEIRGIKDMAARLSQYPTRFYTCHCTGEEAYAIMKDIMGDRLSYVRCGMEIS
ncbi:MAG: MBL fold metallo-hydrolase [Lachnospiraceae bacterium]|nr:MBL fold metallo-hydrolase [Lachnospiraceae bacterium]